MEFHFELRSFGNNEFYEIQQCPNNKGNEVVAGRNSWVFSGCFL